MIFSIEKKIFRVTEKTISFLSNEVSVACL